MRSRTQSRQLTILLVVVGLFLFLASCAGAPPTPTAIQPTATATAPVVVQVPTRTATVPPPTPSSTVTPSATPTSTPTVSPTATAELTPTLASVSTPVVTVTLTMTPGVSGVTVVHPSPTPNAELEAALKDQSNGQYDLAIDAYQAMLDAAPAPDLAREIEYHLAESYLLNRQYVAAASAWDTFVANYPDDSRLDDATLMAARAHQGAGDCPDAISRYEDYLSGDGLLADMVYEWIGDCQAGIAQLAADPSLGFQEAIAAYKQALEVAADTNVQVNLREKIANANLAMQDYEAAVAQYDAILRVARIEAYRANVEYLASQALLSAGQVEAAQARYLRIVEMYPNTEQAYLSLVDLVDAGAPVDEFQRGMVDYYAGADHPDAYPAAVRAFARYLGAEAPPRVEEALYYKALSQRQSKDPAGALDTLDSLITGYPEGDWLVRAWMARGDSYASMGDNARAVKTYRDLSAFFPADDLAPQALWRAAEVREGEGKLAEAAKIYEELQAAFPGYEDADTALWQAGLLLYRSGATPEAIADWQNLLTGYAQSDYRYKTLYWLGKVGARPESAEEPGYWDQLIEVHPHDYYALRVQQIRNQESLTVTRLVTGTVEPPPWNVEQVEAELLSWLRGWTQVPTGTTLISLPAAIAGRADVVRGDALLAAGLRRAALSAYDGVRAAMWDKPLSLARLAIFFHDRGIYGLASRCAMRLVGLWPTGNIYTAPPSLQRLAYPLPFSDLLSAESATRKLDPLLLAAVIRQESLFEPAAESYAGARGLGQVMPATGEGIASALEMEDFVLDDLYRPWVSVRFGAYYVRVQLNRFDDHILVALAAYNGGPGNTLNWLERGGDDLDLFVELIGASQSRIYLQRVYEQYIAYESLYRPAQTG
jgi:soluble lytic murein transglycosylase